MSFRVEWLPDAERELAIIWLNASDREAVTAAAHWIDVELRTNPDEQGESRPDGRRILFTAPLAVIFRVLASEQQVFVSHVWLFKQPAR